MYGIQTIINNINAFFIMKLILYTTVFFIALFSIGLTDQETDITKKLDQVYQKQITIFCVVCLKNDRT